MDLNFYLGGIENIKKNKDKIFFVGKTETLNDDVEKLFKKIGYNKINTYIKEEKKHQTPDEFKDIYYLSELGQKNIQNYYKKDYEIIEYLKSENFIS